jgi:hypothetical protein
MAAQHPMVVVLCYLIVISSFENSHVRKKTTGEGKKDKEIRSGPLASFFSRTFAVFSMILLCFISP